MPTPVELSLASLLPTLSPLPAELIALSNSLLAQSRARASTLNREEEIGRTYACCHIACERLGKQLALEVGKPAPPVQPRVYTKLKTFLSSTLRTPVTPRTTRQEDKLSSVRTNAASEKAVKATPTSARSLRGASSSNAQATPLRKEGVTPVSGRKRKLDDDGGKPTDIADVHDHVQAGPEILAEGAQQDEEALEEEEEVRPVKRPAKTPLRRKEKHAKRNDNLDDLCAAGLEAGLGTMFQPAVDWLSEERRDEFALWKKGIMKEIVAMEKQDSAQVAAS